jgi:hypothetical protein
LSHQPNHLQLTLLRSQLVPVHSQPRSNDTLHKGKIIHITGDSLNGFAHGIKRNYDLQQEDLLFTLVPLCNVEEQNIIDPVDDEYLEENGEEVSARDVIEELRRVCRLRGGV